MIKRVNMQLNSRNSFYGVLLVLASFVAPRGVASTTADLNAAANPSSFPPLPPSNWYHKLAQQHGLLLGRFINSGSYGKVRQALHVTSEKIPPPIVAIKIMGLCPVNVREAAIASAVRGARHLSESKGLLTHTEGLCLVMDCFPQTLRDYIKNSPPGGLSWEAFKTIIRGIYEGIEELREFSLIHADLKPHNIMLMVSKENVPKEVRIIDYGLGMYPSLGNLASTVPPPDHSQQQTRANDREAAMKPPAESSLFTRWYRPPEVMLGSRAYLGVGDLWSLGCIAWELLTGTAPFISSEESGLLEAIFLVLGTPTAKHWPFLTTLPFFRAKTPVFEPVNFATSLRSRIKLLQNPTDEQIDLAAKLILDLLALDPTHRIESGNLRRRHPWLWDGQTQGQQGFEPQFRLNDRTRKPEKNAKPTYSSPFPSPVEQVMIADWLLRITMSLKYSIVCFHGAMTLVDRELSTQPLDAKQLHLRGLAAVEGAAYYFGVPQGVNRCRYVSSDAYSQEDIATTMVGLLRKYSGQVFPNPLMPFNVLFDLRQVDSEHPVEALVAIILTALAHTKALDADSATYLRVVNQLASDASGGAAADNGGGAAGGASASSASQQLPAAHLELRTLMSERLKIYFDGAAEISRRGNSPVQPGLLTWCKKMGIETLYTQLKDFVATDSAKG
jgi:cyclin-dependent kinase 7